MDAQTALERDITEIERTAKKAIRYINSEPAEPTDGFYRDHGRFMLQGMRDCRRLLAQDTPFDEVMAHYHAILMRGAMALQTKRPEFIDFRIGTIAEVQYVNPLGGENGDDSEPWRGPDVMSGSDTYPEGDQ